MDVTGVNPEIASALVQLGVALSTLVFKGTASAIHTKIESLKTEKRIDVIRNSYDEMINQLLEEREEALRIAQTYKNELERVVISDEDIEYLQKTVGSIIDILVKSQIIDLESEIPEKKAKAESSVNALRSIKDLINKDVLKTMQLLGFNYSAAIGEPLTEICAEKIRAIGAGRNNNRRK